MTIAYPHVPSGSAPPPEKLTVQQYHLMIKHGILEEGVPLELLDGMLVRKDRSDSGEDPMTVGIQHSWAVNQLIDLNPQAQKLGCHIRSQQPISLPPINEPEPDAAVIRGSNQDFRKRKPGREDVLAVIEVADSSLRYDRTTKLRIYAQAGIPEYFIINLSEQVIEHYTKPIPAARRYGSMETHKVGKHILLPTPQSHLKMPVRNLLP